MEKPWELSSLHFRKMTLALRKENAAHPTGVLSEVRWWSRCGPRLQRELARACWSGPDGAAPDAPACPSLPRGSCWASGSAGRGPGDGSGRCRSRCRWCHPGSWSAGLAPWACSCPPPCADLGSEKARSDLSPSWTLSYLQKKHALQTLVLVSSESAGRNNYSSPTLVLGIIIKKINKC